MARKSKLDHRIISIILHIKLNITALGALKWQQTSMYILIYVVEMTNVMSENVVRSTNALSLLSCLNELPQLCQFRNLPSGDSNEG
jgi:hypothetical protein